MHALQSQRKCGPPYPMVIVASAILVSLAESSIFNCSVLIELLYNFKIY